MLLYPLKTIENVNVLFCFRRYKNVKMGRNGLKNSRDTKLWKMLSYFDQIGDGATKIKETRTLENTNTIKIESSR